MKAETKAAARLHYLDDPILRRKSAPLDAFTEDDAALVDGMVAIMASHRGVGLAAPQAGVLRRIVVIHPGVLPPGADAVLVNPEIVSYSEETLEDDEGCLSVLSVAAPLARAARATVRYRDTAGREREFTAEEFGARALLHEIEHLDGILFLDHLSRLKRQAVVNQYRRLYRELGLGDSEPAAKKKR
jgi:peptide deformylase